MDLRDSLRSVRRRWRLVLVVVVLAAGAAVAVTLRQTPQYATSVTFFVTTPNRGVTESYQGELFSQQRVKSYASLLTGDRLARAVVDSGQSGGLSVTQVRKRIKARPVPETVLLEVQVTDAQRGRSLQLSRALVTQFSRLIATMETPPGSTTPSVKVEVANGPLTDPDPVSPQPVRNIALALLIGLVAGVGCALLREALDNTVKSAEILDELTGAPVMGSVPHATSARRTPLIVGAEGRGTRAEAVRQIRTNLQFADVDEPLRVLAVTSAVAGEGKSTTAANLAVALAEAGRRVVLVEADLRRPRLGEYLGLRAPVGLTDVLAGQAYLDEALTECVEGRFTVLAAGSVPPNPSVLLGSRHMGELLEKLEERYDVVIVDTPPLLPVTDAAVIAARADGAVVVVRHGRTNRSEVRAAVQALQAVNARVVGCVLNMAPAVHVGRYYDYVRTAPEQREAPETTGSARAGESRGAAGRTGRGRRSPSARSQARTGPAHAARQAQGAPADPTTSPDRAGTAVAEQDGPVAPPPTTPGQLAAPAPTQPGVPGREELPGTDREAEPA